VIAPYNLIYVLVLSKIESVLFYRKKAKPFAKAKYAVVIYSVQVLWRKGEKNQWKDLEIANFKDLEQMFICYKVPFA
jgi:hypothetical protein